MNAVTLMLGAAFLWSLYPALIAISGEKIGAPLFVIIIHLSCGVSAGLFAFLSIKQKSTVWHNLKYYTKSLSMDEWLYLSLIGLSTTLYNFCFFYAMQMTSKVGAAIVIELWPLFAMFLAPLFIKKTWNKLGGRDYLIGFIGIIGVVIVSYDASGAKSLSSLFGNGGAESITGILLALIGGVFVAISIVLSSEVGNRISKHVLQEEKPTIKCAAIAEVARRLVALPPSLLLLWAFKDDLSWTTNGIYISALTGVIVFTMGSLLMRVALLNAKSSNINMLYYISPILSVVWLSLLGLGQLSMGVMLGGALVVIANILIVDRNKK
jgi:drug/metabolite transporter (DMT)-like permease